MSRRWQRALGCVLCLPLVAGYAVCWWAQPVAMAAVHGIVLAFASALAGAWLLLR